MTVTNGEGPPPGLSDGARDDRPWSGGPVPDPVSLLNAVGRSSGPPWLGYLALGLSVLLSLVVLVQETQLSELREQAERSSRDAVAAGHVYQRRLAELEDRTDALTERLRRTLDPVAVARHALPSVFRVTAGRASGTAFAMARTPAGGTYLLSNEHVVEDVSKGDKIRLSREGARHTATLLAVNSRGDVALLETRTMIPLLRLATAPPVPGEPVVVVGAPVGLEDTVTSGVISKIRPIPGRRQRYIQFDAAINPGNSGGPVLDAGGRVVGLATAKVMDAEGIGFAVPIGVACDSFDSIC
jgi:S1-C subfamily serine protease